MPLSWNEIKTRSLAFSKEWQEVCSEDAKAKAFWDGFFNVRIIYLAKYIKTYIMETHG
jgi:hypothetical protein